MGNTTIEKQIIKMGSNPLIEEKDQKTLIKNLTKQLETLSVNSILENKSRNVIKDIWSFKIVIIPS